MFSFSLLLPHTAYAYTFTRALQKGSTGTEVSELQKVLKTDVSVYPEGLVTGYFGALTEKAIQRFQTKYGIINYGTPASTGYGLVGPRTRAKLQEIFNKSNVVFPPRLLQKFYSSSITYDSDYLIISVDELFDSAQGLKAYRERDGRKVSIVKLSDVIFGKGLTDVEKIDTWIENYRKNNKVLKYIVLIGDVGALPSYTERLIEYRHGIPYDIGAYHSDLKYALNNVDYPTQYVPDVSLGRISVRSSAELELYIKKIELFENNFKNRNTILFFGNKAEMSYVEKRDGSLARSLGYNVISLTDPVEADLIAALQNPDLKMIMYYGHGSWYSNGALHQGNLAAWQNNNPILYFSGGCGFGDSSDIRRPLSEILLTNPGGAAASVGASENGGYGFGYNFIKKIITLSKEKSVLGDLFNEALVYHREQSLQQQQDPNLAPLDLWTRDFTMRMSISGDPALRID